MARFYGDGLSMAFDMYGCPQRCLHCWLGAPPSGTMQAEEVFALFSRIREEQRQTRFFGVDIEFFAPDFREPHFAGDYRALYARADAVNGCSLEVERGFELLSLWRLARDPDYAPWARQRGIKRCQMKLFGLEATNDLFHRRRGAHQDILVAMERLFQAGIVPRWQVYLNKRGVAELAGLMALADELQLEQRAAALGEEFNIHAMPFDLAGRGYDASDLSITAGDEALIPELLWQKSKQHFGSGLSLLPEGVWMGQILNEEDNSNLLPESHWLWFFVTADWSVYPNLMGLEPWWCLGNLRDEPWLLIMERYAEDDVPALQLIKTFSRHSLAETHGDENGTMLFMRAQDVIEYWLGQAFRRCFA